MDDSAFDNLTRAFALPSRRAVLSALGAGIFPALVAHDGAEDALAKPKHGRHRNRGHDADAVRASGKKKKKKRKGKKKKKKDQQTGSSPPPPPPGCTPTCGGKECGDDGCGGSCGACFGYARCGGGSCSCPAAAGVTFEFLTKWGSPGSLNGEFNFPEGIAVAPDGTVYVADTGNDRIQYFSATGTFLGEWGDPGTGDDQFDYPLGIAVAPNGTVYVADVNNNRIQRFAAGGTFLDTWGSLGSLNGEFNFPIGIAVHSSCAVYVADFANHRVQVFRPVV